MTTPTLGPTQRGLIQAADAAGFDIRVLLAAVPAFGDKPAHEDIVIVGRRREDPSQPGAIWAFHARWWASGPEGLLKRRGENVKSVTVPSITAELKTGIRVPTPAETLEHVLSARFLDKEPTSAQERAAEKADKAAARAQAKAMRAAEQQIARRRAGRVVPSKSSEPV